MIVCQISDTQDNVALIYSCQPSVHCLNLVRSALIAYEGLQEYQIMKVFRVLTRYYVTSALEQKIYDVKVFPLISM